MDLGLKDKVVVVTGGASGIGRAAVEAFARLGAHVTALDRNADTLARLAAEVDTVETRELDVASAADVDATIDAIAERHGRLDVAVNNAGISRGLGWLHATDESHWDAVIDVNLKGVWLCMRAELRHMYAQRSGVIVNTASAAGFRGGPGVAHYVASKHGVIGLTRTAALEYAQQGIRVNAVCPGAIDTPMMDATFERFPGFRETLTRYVPMGRMGGPEEVAGAIAWLCCDAASFVTGEALTVEGGLLSR
jgi:NAD(P)-dependent dehydrogenase (short-subunit alcohol dehydrogenase family)